MCNNIYNNIVCAAFHFRNFNERFSPREIYDQHVFYLKNKRIKRHSRHSNYKDNSYTVYIVCLLFFLFLRKKNVFIKVLDSVISLFLLQTTAFYKVDSTLYGFAIWRMFKYFYIEHYYVIKRN